MLYPIESCLIDYCICIHQILLEEMTASLHGAKVFIADKEAVPIKMRLGQTGILFLRVSDHTTW